MEKVARDRNHVLRQELKKDFVVAGKMSFLEPYTQC